MPGRTNSKYSKEQTTRIVMTALEVLQENSNALTINEICVQRPSLMGITNQKMARCLNELVDFGMVKKAKNKSTGRMMYMAVSQLEEQGYEI